VRDRYWGLLWLALVASGAGFDAQQSAVAPPRLDVIAPPGLEGAAVALRRVDAQTLTTIVRALGMSDAGPPITIVLAPEDSAVAQQTPSWVVGFADGRAGQIVIFPARAPAYPFDSMEAVLRHEVTHVLVTRAAGTRQVPRWFHEGIALFLERPLGLRDHSELALAVVGGRQSLAALEADFNGSAARAARAYGVAGAFVRDLINRHGAGFPSRVLRELAAGGAFESAFERAASLPLAEAERLFWQESWWYRVFPLLTSSVALWAAILALAAYARRRRRARRTAQHMKWDAEDQED
jgi:hypothetical protein